MKNKQLVLKITLIRRSECLNVIEMISPTVKHVVFTKFPKHFSALWRWGKENMS